MKKLYSIFLVMMLAVVGAMSVQAAPSSLKFKIKGDATNVKISWPGGDPVEIVDGECTVTPPNAAMPIFLQTEPDDMTNITASDGSDWWDPRAGAPSFPLNSYTVSLSNIGSGVEYLTIEINGEGGDPIEEPKDKIIYVHGPEQLAVKFGLGYVDRANADGWAISVSPMNRLDLQVEVQPAYVNSHEISGLKLNGETYNLDHDGQIAFIDVYKLVDFADGDVLDVEVKEKGASEEPEVINGFKLVIDGNADNIQVMNPFAMGTYIEFVDNAYTFDAMPTNSFPVFLQNDAKITNITADDNSALWRAGYGPEFPIENMWTIDPSYINKGATVTIELDGQGGAVVEPTAKTIYVSAPEQCAVKLGEGELLRDDSMGRWAVTLDPANRLELRVQIQQQYTASYKITGSYLNGEPFTGTGNSDDLNIFVDDYTLGEWADGSVLTVTVAERTAAPDDIMFNVNIVGDPSKVTLRYADGSGDIALDANENEAYCHPDNNSLIFEHVAFGSTLYKVEVDGDGTVTQQGVKWLYEAADGDIVTVTVESDEPVSGEPVSFTFVNDGTADVIMNALVGGANVSWNTPGFTLPKGTILDVQFDTYSYVINKVTCNGNDVTANAVRGSYSVTVPAGGLSLVVDAQVKAPVQVTFNVVGDPAGVQYAFGWSCSNATVLTSSPQVVAVPVEYSVVNVCSMPGYTIEKIESSNGSTFSNDTFIEVHDGDVYTVYVTKEASDGSIMVFVEDTKWIYLKLGWNLSQGNAEKSFEYGNNLSTGYTELDYVKNSQFSVTGYPAPIVYVNNENAEVWNPTHEWMIYDAFNMQPLNPGDVVKAFRVVPQSFDVTYDIDSEIPVKVYHDKVRHMDNPGVHTEFHGTEICIKPNAEMQAFALNASEIKVTVNDNVVTPNEAGEYVVNVTDHMTVKVAKAGDAVDSIISDSNDNEDIYNLQGIKVSSKNLPAGVYIKGGKKILVK